MSPLESTRTPLSQRPFDEQAESERLLARCERLVQKARSAGAEEAEAFGARSESISVRFEHDDLKLTQVDEGSSIGVRVFRDAKLGFSSTNQADDASLETAARDALELSSFNPPDEYNRLPEPRPIEARPWSAKISDVSLPRSAKYSAARSR